MSAFSSIADVLEYDWQSIARSEQLPPPGDWSTWLVLAGRGWGKTRCGAENGSGR
jgi:phage terminase large subunit-like protein